MRTRHLILLAAANAIYEQLGFPERREHACLFWAHSTMLALQQLGYDACLQAGSVSWRRVPRTLNSIVTATHYSYEFDAQRAAQTLPDTDCLPEMHCWAGIVSRQQIVDVTTCYQPAICRRLGLQWLTQEHELLWDDPQTLSERYDHWYRVDPEATILAGQLLAARELSGI